MNENGWITKEEGGPLYESLYSAWVAGREPGNIIVGNTQYTALMAGDYPKFKAVDDRKFYDSVSRKG